MVRIKWKGKLPQPPEIKDEDQNAPFPIFDFGGEEDSSLSFPLFKIVVSLGTVIGAGNKQ